MPIVYDFSEFGDEFERERDWQEASDREQQRQEDALAQLRSFDNTTEFVPHHFAALVQNYPRFAEEPAFRALVLKYPGALDLAMTADVLTCLPHDLRPRVNWERLLDQQDTLFRGIPPEIVADERLLLKYMTTRTVFVVADKLPPSVFDSPAVVAAFIQGWTANDRSAARAFSTLPAHAKTVELALQCIQMEVTGARYPYPIHVLDNAPPHIVDSPAVWIALAPHGSYYKFPPAAFHNKEFVLAAAAVPEQGYWVVHRASEALKQDRDVLAAALSDPCAVIYLNMEHADLYAAACIHHPEAFTHALIATDLREALPDDVLLIVLTANGAALEFVPPHRRSRELLIAAAKTPAAHRFFNPEDYETLDVAGLKRRAAEVKAMDRFSLATLAPKRRSQIVPAMNLLAPEIIHLIVVEFAGFVKGEGLSINRALSGFLAARFDRSAEYKQSKLRRNPQPPHRFAESVGLYTHF